MIFRKKRSVVGIAVDDQRVRAVCLSPKHKRWQLDKKTAIDLQDSLQNLQQIFELIPDYFQLDAKIHIVISCARTLIKLLKFEDALTSSEIKVYLHQQAASLFSFENHEIYFDYKTILSAKQRKHKQIIAIAAKKDFIQTSTAQVIDIDIFAILRALIKWDPSWQKNHINAILSVKENHWFFCVSQDNEIIYFKQGFEQLTISSLHRTIKLFTLSSSTLNTLYIVSDLEMLKTLTNFFTQNLKIDIKPALAPFNLSYRWLPACGGAIWCSA